MKTLPTVAIILSVVAIAAVWAQSVEQFDPAQPTWPRLVTVTNFPNPQNVAGTVNVGNLPAVQQVAGTVEVGNLPATGLPYRLVGFSTEALDGSHGVFSYTLACQAAFPESRMCTSEEVLTTIDLPPSPVVPDPSDPTSVLSAWVRPSVIGLSGVARDIVMDISGATELLASGGLTCDHWNSSANNRAGLAVYFESNFARYGQVGGRDCQKFSAVACCAPVE